MKTVATFIAPIYNITVSESLGRGDRLDDVLWLTNDTHLIRSKISGRLVDGIGVLERDSVCRAGLVAYGEFTDERCPSNIEGAETFVAIQLAKLHRFLQDLWWLKDNAARVENGFVEHPRYLSSRFWPMICTMADGADSVITFSRDEVRNARLLYSKKPNAADWGETEFRKGLSSEVIEPDSNPWSRASYFIATARSHKQLSVKIANYCSALESLLVTSPNELTYRLSERVAWLLGETVEERCALFQQVKNAYDFRSKVVHGSHVSERKLRNDLIPAVRACDSILRGVVRQIGKDEVLLAYVKGENKNADRFEDRLMQITLGADLLAKAEQ
jgi:hypothetical protein